METTKIITDWLLINSDGDWEHENGIRISTLDNPGWSVEISLINTFLENRTFNYSQKTNTLDWIEIDIKNNLFIGSGSVDNLVLIIDKFYFDFFLKNLNEYRYTVYFPVKDGVSIEFWRPVECKVIESNLFEIIEIPLFNLSDIKVKNVEDFDKINISSLEGLEEVNQNGLQFSCCLIDLFDGTNLAFLAFVGM